jgi:hypothetical protein
MPNTGSAAPGFPGVALFDPVSGTSVTNGSGAIQTVPAGVGTGLTATAPSSNYSGGTASGSIKSTPGRVFQITVTSAYTVANPLITDGNGGTTIIVVPLAVGTYTYQGVFNTSIYFNLNGATAGGLTVAYS